MKSYPSLRLLWAALVVSAVTVLGSLFPENGVSLAASILNLAAYGVVLYILHRLSEESARFGRAFSCQLISLFLSILALACTFMGTSDMMVHFMVLLMVTGSLFSLISQYHMYWALDERVIPCGYAYPARRIRWCFYTPLIGAVAASFIQTLFYQNPAALVVQLVCQLAPLVLLWQYLRAVKNREDDPLHM